MRISVPSQSCIFNFVEERRKSRRDGSKDTFEDSDFGHIDEEDDDDTLSSEGLPPMAESANKDDEVSTLLPATADRNPITLPQPQWSVRICLQNIPSSEEENDEDDEVEPSLSPGVDTDAAAKRRRLRRKIFKRKRDKAKALAAEKAAQKAKEVGCVLY